MYRSTPHPTTSVSLVKLLFNCKINTKLPELNSNFIATYCDICVSDKVLLKQVKNDKGSTTLVKGPFVVISRSGNSVVIENEKGRFERNIHMKRKSIR